MRSSSVKPASSSPDKAIENVVVGTVVVVAVVVVCVVVCVVVAVVTVVVAVVPAVVPDVVNPLVVGWVVGTVVVIDSQAAKPRAKTNADKSSNPFFFILFLLFSISVTVYLPIISNDVSLFNI